MEVATLRMKAKVEFVKKCVDQEGKPSQEEISLSAVYDSRDGSANSQWCKWTPWIQFNFTINNPAAFDKVLPGQYFFIDLIPTEKDSL